MITTLRHSLTLLSSTIATKSTAEANNIVNDIRNISLGALSPKDIGLCCSLLIKADTSLLHFIKKINLFTEFGKCKENALILLQEFMERIGHKVSPFVSDISDTCIAVFNVDRLTANKEKAIYIMIKLIEFQDRSTDSKCLDVACLKDLCFKELARRSGTSSTVKGHCYHMLGIMAQYYPQEMASQGDRLCDIYLRELKREMQSNKRSDFKIIEGCLKGLSHLLINFTKGMDEDADVCREIYKFMMMSIQPKTDLSRYAVPIAGMQILQRHASQFGCLLTENYETVYNALQNWFNHRNNDLKHGAHMALRSFFQQLTLSALNDTNSTAGKQMLVFFLRQFEEMLEVPDSTSKALSVAIHGYGLFAKLCRRYMAFNNVQSMLTRMIGRCEKIYLGQDMDENQLHLLPVSIQSLANVVKEIIASHEPSATEGNSMIIPESFRRSLSQMSVLAMAKYPYLNRKFSQSCCNSLISIMHSFHSSPDTQHSFVSQVVYQGLIRCCSLEVVIGENREDKSDDVQDVTSDFRTTTYRDYLSLWKGLICPSKISNLHYVNAGSFTKSEHKEVQQMIYNELICSIISVISKLNLSVKTDQTDDLDKYEEGQDFSQLSANNLDDFKIFINLADLCGDLLPLVTISEEALPITAHLFQDRTNELIQQLVRNCTRYPLVSGFYKLLSKIMDICIKLKYFDEKSTKGRTQTSDDHCIQQRQCACLIRKFVPEVISHMIQWKDDLLSSCLMFVFSLPSELAENILEILVSPLQRAFQLGLSYTPLAEAAINAMERWRDDLTPSRVMKSFMLVLPELEPFLHVVSKEDGSTGLTYMNSRKRRNYSKFLSSSLEMDEPALQKVCSKVVRFLGSVGSNAHACIENASLDSDKSLFIVWDKNVSIPYAIPFREMKLDIQLQYFLPRVTELASLSTNRQTKVAACELLHAMTVYMIGRNAQQDESMQQRNPMASIYAQIFPLILKLACDVEQVCRQLFEPLVMQMIHWFTNNRKYESPDTVQLLNAILNGLINESDGSLRNLCALAVKEFLIWSIKQDTQSGNTARKNVKSVLKRLFNLARHPSPGKRLGSAVAFNHFYRVFREQETFIDEFLLELLVVYVDSLAMAHYDKHALGTQRECVKVLKHVQRMVKEKRDLLNKESKNRRLPPGFDHSKPVILSSLVDWLFKQCGRPHTECRHQCMELFEAFVPLLPQSLSAAKWMKKKLTENGGIFLVTCFEGNSSKNGIAQHPRMDCGQSVVKAALDWFDMFLASLDCYFWAFQAKILQPSDIFQGDHTNIFRCMDYFSHDIAKCNIQNINKESSDIFTPHEEDIFNEMKCTVIVRMLQFVVLMLKQYPEQSFSIIPESLWEADSLLGVMALSAVNPESVGFNVSTNVEIAKQLPPLMAEAVSTMVDRLPDVIKKKFISELTDQIFMNGSFLHLLPSPFNRNSTSSSLILSSQLIQAYRLLHKSGILCDILQRKCEKDMANEKLLAGEIMKMVFHSVVKTNDDTSLFKTLISLSPEFIEFGNQLLALSFNLGVATHIVMTYIMDLTPLSTNAGSKLVTNHGQVFFSTFKAQLCKEMCTKSSEYIPLIIQDSPDQMTACSLVSELLEYLLKDRQSRKNYSATLCNEILNEWNKNLSCLWQTNNASVESTNAALTVFKKIVSLDTAVCKDPSHPAYESAFQMLNNVLMSPSLSLSLKTQAMDLLCFFCLSPDKKRDDDIRRCLLHVSSSHFPSRSDEFQPGTSRYADYVAAIRGLLSCLELSESSAVLEVLIKIMCQEEHHILEDEFQTSMENFMENLKEEDQKSKLDVPYLLFSDVNSSHSMSIRSRIIHRVFIPLSLCCSANAANEFFTAHIGDIMKIILEDHQRFSSVKWKDQLIAKMCCYKLTEIMFSLLSPDIIKSDSSPLVQAFASSPAGGGSTKLLKTFMSRIIRDKNEDMSGESELLEERRKFHCAVYNALISAVMCTQLDIKWYDAFLFSDNANKKEFLFDNIINKQVKYAFPVEIDNAHHTHRKRLISVRQKHKENARELGQESLAYIPSLAGSSLSEDVNQFDNNLSQTVEKQTWPSKDAEEEIHPDDAVVLEDDEINSHECMSNLISLILHMKKNKIGFPKDDDNAMETNLASTPPIPKWMNNLIRKLNSTTHLNVKIFIAKLITNCERFFHRFASYWITPMIKVVLQYFKKKNEEGDSAKEIDQFVIDTVVTLLSWTPAGIPMDNIEVKVLIRALLDNLMKNIRHKNNSVFRHNLEIVKTILECWRERISDINTDIIYEQCSSTDLKSQENFSGLQLLGALLANDLPPYTPSIEIDRDLYFRRICNNMLSQRKAMVDTASEVVGMSLKFLALKENELDGEIHNIVQITLQKLMNSSKSVLSSFAAFISCLHKVARHHPPAAEPFLTKILFNLPKLPGSEIQTCCIEILCSCADKIDLLAELKAKSFISMLIHRDENLQRACLKLCAALLNKTVGGIDDGKISPAESKRYYQECVRFFLPSVEKHFIDHPSPLCRQEMYELAMKIYDNQKCLPSEEQSEDIIQSSKLILLQGLNDTEEMLRTQVINFWSEDSDLHQARLPNDPAGKMICLFGDLYDSRTEEPKFLASCCNLLMQASSKSPDFERPVFDNPLSECVFQEFAINHHWQHRYSSMTPMFIETMQSTLAYSSLSSPSQSSPIERQRKPNVLQATQDQMQFTETVNGGKNTYNWMTGGSVDTFSGSYMAIPQQKESALVALHDKAKRRRHIQSVKPQFEKYDLKTESAQGHQIDVMRLRRKFQKEKSDSRIRFARYVVKKKKQEEIFIKREKAQKKHGVHMYRTYRVGELPDIEIPHRGLVTPLAALSQLDPVFSCMLLSSLMQAILQEHAKGTAKENSDYSHKLTETLTQVLTSTQQFHPAFIGCILNVVRLNSTSIKIDPSLIAHASINSNQTSLGIRVLEEWLIQQQEPAEPVAKRRKHLQKATEVNEIDICTWIELARCYKDKSDVLRGIFTGSVVSRSIFSDALHLETQSQYNQAFKVYQQALLTDWDAEPSDVEKDLWEDCLLNCLQNLGKWNEVNKFCDLKIADGDDQSTLDNVWLNANIQRRFLSLSIHAKLNLLLQDVVGHGREIMSFIDNALKYGEERKNTIEHKHPDDIAMLYIHQEDYDQANYYLQKAINSFTEEWTNMDSSQTDKKEILLVKVYRLSDLSDFIDMMKKHSAKQLSDNAVTDMIDRWSCRFPHPTHDPINVLEHIMTYRSFLIDKAIRMFSTERTDESQEISMEVSPCLRDLLEKKKLYMNMQAVENACMQKHFSIARNFLNGDVEAVMRYFRSMDNEDDFSKELMLHSQITARYYLSYTQHLINIGLLPTERKKLVKAISQAYTVLQDKMQNAKEMIGMEDEISKQNMLLGQTCDMAATILDNDVESNVVESLKNLIISDTTVEITPDAVKSGIRMHAYEYFEKSVESYIGNVGKEQLLTHVDSCMAMVKFCDKQLHESEKELNGNNAESDISPQHKEYAKNVVKYVLLSMKYCYGEEVSLRFPRLLQLIDKFPEVKPCFMKETSELPSWMFLRWTSQMVALLDKQEADAVHDLMLKLAGHYPQAVIYPVKTSLPDFQFFRNEIGKRNKKFVKNLHDELTSKVPLAEVFINNLCLLSSPANIFKDWQEEMIQLFKAKNKSGWSTSVITKYQNMYNEILACSQSASVKQEQEELYAVSSSASSSPPAEASSPYRRNFAKIFKQQIDKLFGGPTGGGLLRTDEKKFQTATGKIVKEMFEYCKSQKLGTLKEYSRWLACFHSMHLNGQELEIPGQYKGISKPSSEYHAKIIGFEDIVKVMPSLQQPKRITIKASDGHEYFYLVKGNEDLRQDQRIQQVFEVINTILRQDQECWRRKLYIDTYQVIPISSRVGLIEWVDETESLQEVIYGEAMQMNCKEKMEKPPQVYNKWIQKYSKTDSDKRSSVKLYGNVVKMANMSDAHSIFREVVSLIPQGLLRNAYLRLSASPESFLNLRQKFATTYGTLCVAHWILGIGDRHTSNCMISKKSGAAIGIDFGHAFGTATEGLPVPELVPFRLSPQLCYLMTPHPAKQGKLRQSMVFCMSALRSSQDTILAMLDIFLKEPSVDWMKFANKMIRVHGSGVADVDYSGSGRQSSSCESAKGSSGSDVNRGTMRWYPLRKISIVKQKLSGWKPSIITEDELQHNYQVPKNYLPYYKALVVGSESRNFRTAHEDKNLSVDNQVDCLIDQATDPNLLARTFIGWRFWL